MLNSVKRKRWVWVLHSVKRERWRVAEQCKEKQLGGWVLNSVKRERSGGRGVLNSVKIERWGRGVGVRGAEQRT